MNDNKPTFGPQERDKLLTEMQNFHRHCVSILHVARRYPYLHDALTGMVGHMDDAAELLAGHRRFLYTAQAGQMLKPRL